MNALLGARFCEWDIWMREVFVSHSSHDTDAARVLATVLERAGMKALHGPSIPGDSSIELDRTRKTTACVVVLWSVAAAKSEFVQEEIQRAIHAWSDGRLILVTLDDSELPRGLRDLQPLAIRRVAGEFDTGTFLERVRAVVGWPEPVPKPHPDEMLSVQHSTPVPPASALRARTGSRATLIVSLLLLMVTMGAGSIMYFATLREPPLRAGSAQPPPPSAPMPDPLPAPAPRPEPEPPATPSGAPAAEEPSWPTAMILMSVGIAGGAIGAGAAWAIARRRRSRLERLATAAHPIVLPAASNDVPVVFVSYSRQDNQAVDRLVRHIEQAGYAIWIDRHSTGSQRYAAAIVRAIKTSNLVALMCSTNAFESDHVIREVYVAGDYKKPFIAFQLDTCEFPDEVLYFVSGFPRIPVERLDPQQLGAEIARLVTA